MEFFFKKKLSEQEVTEAEKFYDSLENVTIEQNVLWSTIEPGNTRNRFFYAKEKSEFECFAIIKETVLAFFRTAEISFGPLFKSSDSLISSIHAIREYYRAAGYYYLSIQLAIPSGHASEYIEYQLNKRFKIKYVFDRNNWSSLVIKLQGVTVDEIIRQFSKGHKSAVKKSIAQGVTVRQLTCAAEIQELSLIYEKMSRARDLHVGNETTDLFIRTFNFLNNYHRGFFLGVFDKNKSMVGGIIIVIQGKTARYYKGASDPDRKELAILHMAILEGVRLSQVAGCNYFDLWGYNHMVNENDQVYYINRFKKGFSEDYFFYPKRMHVPLKIGGYFVHKGVLFLKAKLKRAFSSLSVNENRR